MVGLPKAIIKKYGVTKKAWAVFRAHHRRKSLHSYVKKAKKAKSRSVKSTTRRKGKGHHSRKSMVGAVEKIIGAGAFAAPGLSRAVNVWNAEHNGGRAVLEGVSQYAGFQDGKFDFGVLAGAWTPFLGYNVVRYGVHKIIGLIRKV